MWFASGCLQQRVQPDIGRTGASDPFGCERIQSCRLYVLVANILDTTECGNKEMETDRLLGRIADGDEGALAALYDQTLSRMWGVAMRMVQDSEAAQEIVSDSYLQIWNQARRFDPDRSSGIGWMLMITRCRAIDHLRRERGWRQHQTLDTVDENPRLKEFTATLGEGDDPESWLSSLQSATALHHALATLDKRAHRLLGLAFFSGMTHAEIADHTGEPLGTIKSRIRRAQLQLRELLRRH